MHIILGLFAIILFGCSKSEKDSSLHNPISTCLKQASEFRRSNPREAIPILLRCDSMANKPDIDKELKFKTAITLAETYFRIRSLDSVQYYLDKADKQRASEKNNAELYRTKGNLFWAYEQHDSALFYYNKSLIIFEKLEDLKSQAYLKFNMANILSKRGQKAESLEKYLEAIEYFEKDGNYYDVAGAYTNAAGIMEAIGNYEGAKEYIRKALSIATNYKLKERLPMVYSRMASIYIKLVEPDSALYYHMLPFHDKSAQLNKTYQMISYNNIGDIYYEFYQKDSIDKAKHYFEMSLQLANELNHEFGKKINQFYLLNIQIYSEPNINYNSTIQKLEEFKPFLQKGEHPDVMEDFYNALSFAYKKKGEYELAFDLHRKSDSIIISTLNNSVQEKVLFVENQYQTKLRDEELSSKEKLLKKNKLILQIVLLASVLTIFFILYQVRLQKKKHSLLKELNNLTIKDKENAENELKMQKKELASALLNLSHTKEMLQYIKQQISIVVKNKRGISFKDFRHIFKNIDEQSGDSYWEEFYSRFEELQSDFMNKLISRHEKLTPNEIRICVLLRLNLSSKDIANLTNRSLRTVENIRYSIRKKMDLTESESLTRYILSI